MLRATLSFRLRSRKKRTATLGPRIGKKLRSKLRQTLKTILQCWRANPRGKVAIETSLFYSLGRRSQYPQCGTLAT